MGQKVVTKFRKPTEILGTLLKAMSIASVMSTSVNYSLTPPPRATDKPTYRAVAEGVWPIPSVALF